MAAAKKRKTAVENQVFRSMWTEKYVFVCVKETLFFLSAMENLLF
jgi:hypothetical protein